MEKLHPLASLFLAKLLVAPRFLCTALVMCLTARALAQQVAPGGDATSTKPTPLTIVTNVVPAQPRSTNVPPAAVQPKPSPPAASLKSFQLAPGFKIQLVAAEPMLSAPVAMAFDENGRLFVVERSQAGAALTGRVRLLESFDEEGKVKASRIYAVELPGASAIACYAGGVFVAAGHDVFYLKNLRQDGGADIRQVVLTGFGGTNGLRGDQLVNNFHWGLEDRIYAASACLGGLAAAANAPGGPVSLDGCDLSFDPRTLAVAQETGVAETGLCFDTAGRRFFCAASRPLQLAMYEHRYIARNPFCPRADGTIDVASPATPAFLHAQLPSSIMAAQQFKPRPGVATPTWLTEVSSCLIYRGTLFPTNLQGNAFIASAGEHLVHRAVLRDYGFGIAAERPAEEKNREFLSSSDPWFRPMQLITGPEGALYIADYQDGQERGRIYRVVPAAFTNAPSPQLGHAVGRDLVAALAGAGWHSDTAARLLYERRDPATVPLLVDMATHSRTPVARLHALHALSSAGALREAHVLAALKDNDPVVREHAIQLAETVLTNQVPSEPLWTELKALSADPVLRVRYQLAFSLGAMRRPDRTAVLAEVLRRDVSNPWMQGAVLSSVSEGGGELFVQLASDAGFLAQPAGHNFLVQLGTMLGIQGRMSDVVPALKLISQGGLAQLQTFSFLDAMGEGLYRTRSALALLDPTGVLQPIYIQARDAMVAGNLLPDPTRVAAIRLLSFSTYTYSDVSDWLLLLCGPQVRPAVQAAAISTLGRYDDPRAVSSVLSQWATIPPPTRSQFIDAWLSRASHVPAVLDAVAAKQIGTNDLSSLQQNFLRTYPDEGLQQKALELLGPVRLNRPQVVAAFQPALRLIGIAEAGRSTFIARCASCHRLGTTGQSLGPDLTGARTLSKEQLLRKVLQPNETISPGYGTWVLESKPGDNVVGVGVDENAIAVNVRQVGVGQAVWPRENIMAVHREMWSLMPEGIEAGMSPQDMADLLEYLMTAPAR